MQRPFGLILLAFLMTACVRAPAQDLGLSLGAPAAEATDPSAPQLPRRPGRVFTAEAPAKIMVVGDSLSQGFADGLKARAAERGVAAVVANRGRVSTGLSRVDFYDWPTNFASLLAAEKPDIVVAHFGANDMQGVTRPDNKAGYGSEGWEKAYRAEMRRILQSAADAGVVVVWLGPAPDGNSGLGKHMKMIAPLFASEAAASGAVYIPLANWFSNADGNYVTAVEVGGKSTTVRTGDGSHFNLTGYRMVGDIILDDIIRRFPDLMPSQDALAMLQ